MVSTYDETVWLVLPGRGAWARQNRFKHLGDLHLRHAISLLGTVVVPVNLFCVGRLGEQNYEIHLIFL